jgi:hypothetical protein
MESKPTRISEYSLTKIRDIAKDIGNPSDDTAIRHVLAEYERLKLENDIFRNVVFKVNNEIKPKIESEIKRYRDESVLHERSGNSNEAEMFWDIGNVLADVLKMLNNVSPDTMAMPILNYQEKRGNTNDRRSLHRRK